MNGIIIGSIGVGLLLIAFILNLLRMLHENSPIYLSMNIVGALLAAWYAYEGKLYPFIVLEFVWALTAFIRLFFRKRKTI